MSDTQPTLDEQINVQTSLLNWLKGKGEAEAGYTYQVNKAILASLKRLRALEQPKDESPRVYLTVVPDHHDRIIWRKRYYMLNEKERAPVAEEAAKGELLLPFLDEMSKHANWCRKNVSDVANCTCPAEGAAHEAEQIRSRIRALSRQPITPELRALILEFARCPLTTSRDFAQEARWERLQELVRAASQGSPHE